MPNYIYTAVWKQVRFRALGKEKKWKSYLPHRTGLPAVLGWRIKIRVPCDAGVRSIAFLSRF
jgi:hypothetical protein